MNHTLISIRGLFFAFAFLLIPILFNAQSVCNPAKLSLSNPSVRCAPMVMFNAKLNSFESAHRLIFPTYNGKMTLVVENIALQDETMVEIWPLRQDCDFSDSEPLKTSDLNSQKTIIDLAGLGNIAGCIIRLANKNRAIGVYRISVKINYSTCNLEHTTIKNPEILKLLNNEICLESCNHNTFATEQLISSQVHKSRLKWFKIDTDDLLFLDMYAAAENTEDYIEMVMVSYSEGEQYSIEQLTFGEGIAQLTLVPVHNFKQILIGIGSPAISNLSFDLCITAYDDQSNDCIDFVRPGDTLYAVSTSFGSPLTGPFIPGEWVSFTYEINSWFPIRNNWLHSVLPSFGSGWCHSSFDSISLEPTECIINDSLAPAGNWVWISPIFQEEQNREKGGRRTEGGWYFSNTSEGPRINKSLESWGRYFDQYQTKKEPLLKLNFSLKVKDSLQCHEHSDLTIKINPFSDVSTGNYRARPCICEPQLFETTLFCCGDMEEIVLRDTVICRSDENVLTLNTTEWDVQWYFQSEGDIKWINLGDGLQHTIPGQISRQDERSRIHIMAVGTHHSNMCFDTVYADFSIVNEPLLDLPDLVEACYGDRVEFAAESFVETEVDYIWTPLNAHSTFQFSSNYLFGDARINEQFQVLAVNQWGCSTIHQMDLLIHQPDIPTLDSFRCHPVYASVKNELRPGTSTFITGIEDEITYSLHQWDEIPPGRYILKTKSDFGCEAEVILNKVQHPSRDSLYIVFCEHDGSDPFEEERRSGEYVHYYFKSSNCPNADTVISYLFCPKNIDLLDDFDLVHTVTIQNDIILYPNPASDDIIVDGTSQLERALSSIVVLNIFGNVLDRIKITDGEVRLDISHLKPGTYYLVLIDEQQYIISSKSFIKR